MLEHFTKEVITYCENHTNRSNDVLDRIEASTREHSNQINMLSGAYQGSLLRMLSRLVEPRRVLEVGTFTGYSAVCLAEGMTEDGKVISLEKDHNLKDLIEKHLSWTSLGKKIEVRYGDAKELLPQLEDVFDLVFIDAAKREYGLYYEESIKRLRSGGLMIIDNVLWRGKVVDAEPDKKTQSIQKFNEMVAADDRVEPFLMPIRDGVYLVQKK
ncbi:class I SAM-dependent methyltransferase [Membranicola marinus]|uniref:Class I SAM-dependent methyltransferase n=1 Tax=Membranihabitans marinus TaxID=1227546 RepID=A0A953LB76_9BACT|nr:class I SAM-dependent methyltransferase [Membranihabitans marinus]MBY5958301.1 class I SAM-dependent methyltransferase [Membranihabitans marinus]